MNTIIGIFMGVVLLVLIAGLVVMAIGGKTNEKYSNKLMMMRVASQALVIFILGAMFVVGK